MQLAGRRGVRSTTANATNTSFEIDLVANYQLASSRVRAIDSTSLQQLGPRCALDLILTIEHPRPKPQGSPRVIDGKPRTAIGFAAADCGMELQQVRKVALHRVDHVRPPHSKRAQVAPRDGIGRQLVTVSSRLPRPVLLRGA